MPARLRKKRLQNFDHSGRDRIIRQFQYDDSGVLGGRVVPNVREIEVAGNEGQPVFLSVSGDLRVAGSTQTNVTNVDSLVSKSLNGSRRRPGHICI